METNVIYNEECLQGMEERIPNNSIDMILADLPYGTTACEWDSIIPLEPLWEQYKRIIKDDTAIVLTASQPFTTKLIASNIDWFKYCWYWEKERLTNIHQVKNRAGKTVEEIVVFYNNQPTYNPQMRNYNGPKRTNGVKDGTLGKLTDNQEKNVKEYEDDGTRYPTQVIRFKRDILTNNLHPTQKPVNLFKYLIETYTNEGDIVLDNVIGSGTTAVAAKALDRQYIGFEKDSEYYEIAQKRVSEVQKELI